MLDGYSGEDCIVLDDLRPSCLGLSDLLKLLDNNTSSTVKSRYKNKTLECKMIIITTTLGIEEFFHNVFSEEPETIIQLKRRCGTIIEFPNGKADKLYIREYDETARDYGSETEIENPVPKLIAKEKVDKKRKLDRFKF